MRIGVVLFPLLLVAAPVASIRAQVATPPTPPPISHQYEFIETVEIGGSADTQNALSRVRLSTIRISPDNNMVLFSADKSLRAAALWLRDERTFVEYTNLDESETTFRREQSNGKGSHPNRSGLMSGTQATVDALTSRGFLVPCGQIGESRQLIDKDGKSLVQSPSFSRAVFELPLSSSSSFYFVRETYSSDAPQHLMAFDDFKSVSLPQPIGFQERVFPNTTFRIAFRFTDRIEVYSLTQTGSWRQAIFSFPANWKYSVKSTVFVNEDQWLALHVINRFNATGDVLFLDCNGPTPSLLADRTTHIENQEDTRYGPVLWVNQKGTRLVVGLKETDGMFPQFYDLIDARFRKVANVNSHKELKTVFRNTDFGFSPDGTLVGFRNRTSGEFGILKLSQLIDSLNN